MHPFDFFKPSPIPYSLIRIGGQVDGAYVIPDDLCGIDACFSPGVNNFKEFEDQLSLDYGIKSHMCDFSSNPDAFMTPLIRGMQTFKKLWLDVEGGKDTITLDDWVNSLSPDNNLDLILQIDIEGAEYRNLLACSETVLRRFRIIVIELHRLNEPDGSTFFEHNIRPLCDRLKTSHVVVHAHPNNCCGQYIDQRTGMNIPSALELTLLRRDRLQFSHNSNPVILPHPQDIVRNVKQEPPIHLNDQWLRSLSLGSLNGQKIIADYRDYCDYATLRDSIRRNTIRYYQASIESMQQMWSDDIQLLQSDDQKLLEVAEGKPYSLSSAYNGLPKQGIVTERDPFFFHTDIGTDQKIIIDLAGSFVLSRMELRNRTDGWWHRAECLFVQVSQFSDLSNAKILPVPACDEFLSGRIPTIGFAMGGIVGRYVVILSPSETALHFAGLKIYGQKS